MEVWFFWGLYCVLPCWLLTGKEAKGLFFALSPTFLACGYTGVWSKVKQAFRIMQNFMGLERFFHPGPAAGTTCTWWALSPWLNLSGCPNHMLKPSVWLRAPSAATYLPLGSHSFCVLPNLSKSCPISAWNQCILTVHSSRWFHSVTIAATTILSLSFSPLMSVQEHGFLAARIFFFPKRFARN